MYVKINLYSLNKNKILVFYDSSRYGGNLHLWYSIIPDFSLEGEDKPQVNILP